MKIAKGILIAAASLAVVFFAGGMLMPSAIKVERTTVIAAPPAKIYALIVDPRAWPKWEAWSRRDPSMKTTYAGAPSGPGAKWSWTGKDGPGEMELTAAEPDKSVSYSIFFPDGGMRATGQLVLTPEPGGTRVDWKSGGDVGKNPVMRWFVPFLDNLIGKDFAEGLAGLKAVAEKN